MMCGIIERSDEEVSNTEAGKRAWTVQICEENAVHLFLRSRFKRFFNLLRSQFSRILIVSVLNVLWEVFCLLVCRFS